MSLQLLKTYAPLNSKNNTYLETDGLIKLARKQFIYEGVPKGYFIEEILFIRTTDINNKYAKIEIYG